MKNEMENGGEGQLANCLKWQVAFTSPVRLGAGDTIILPAGSHPSVPGPSPPAQTLMDALWAAGYPAFALGLHLPGLETFPWQRWWRLVRRRQFHQSRLARWLVALCRSGQSSQSQSPEKRFRHSGAWRR